MKACKLYGSIGLAVIALAVSAWFLVPSGVDLANASVAEYQIEKLTCGSCVSNIKSALEALDGISAVEVNLTSNRGRVSFDASKIDSGAIAETISGAGYPATLRFELDPGAFAALEQEQAQLGQDYVARIGDRLLARTDFELLVQQSSSGKTSAEVEPQVVQSIWKDVLQRELLLVAAAQNQIVIQDGEVDARLDQLRQQHQGLESLLARKYGSLDVFRERMREDMIITRNIENNVYAGETDARARQDKLQAWYTELQNNTEVIIYDPRLKALAQSGSGCACCNS